MSIAYRTVLEDTHREGDPDVYGMLLEGRIDVVTFTSASAVRNFAKVFGRDQAADLLKSTAVAAIGPVTAEAAAQLGIQRDDPAGDSYTIPGLVDAIAAHYRVSGHTEPRPKPGAKAPPLRRFCDIAAGLRGRLPRKAPTGSCVVT